jgi:hypothetical protein
VARFFGDMASKESFFIRGKVGGGTGAFIQTEIDIGHVVDALGKTVMRIHNISAQVWENAPRQEFSMLANTGARIAWQLTTSSQSDIVDATDRSVIATGALDLANTTTGNQATTISDRADILPQHWTNGFLVGVDQLYLGIYADTQLSEANVALVLECTAETLSQSAAMSLALSQQ